MSTVNHTASNHTTFRRGTLSVREFFITRVPLILVIIALLIGAALRLFRLGEVPAVLNRDEAALAYNALLLKEVGKDEWGLSWPLQLQSFGDYKLLGYVAATVVSFSLFGYSDWAVRLPSAVAGIGLIFLTYVFARKVLSFSARMAAVSAVLIAVTPIFFFYSRLGFEANLALSFFCLSLFLLFGRFSSFGTFPLLDIFGTLFFLVAVITYNTPLLLTPMVVISLIGWRGWKNWRLWIAPCLALGVILIVGVSLLSESAEQKKGITLFADEATHTKSIEFYQNTPGLLRSLLGNKFVFYGLEIGSRYIASFSPEFLVTRGGTHPWHALPEFGHIYWLVYGFFWVGMLSLMIRMKHVFWALLHRTLRTKQKIQKTDSIGTKEIKETEETGGTKEAKETALLIFWLLFSLVPAAITVDSPHATRSLFFFWLMIFIAVKGMKFFWEMMVVQRGVITNMWKMFSAKVFVVVLLGWLVMESTIYFSYYFEIFPLRDAGLYKGFPEVIRKVERELKTKEQQSEVQAQGSGGGEQELQVNDQNSSFIPVAVVDASSYQYILTAWYLKLPSAEFFSTIVRQLPDKIGFRYGERVGRYHFIGHKEDRSPKESVLIFWDEKSNVWRVEGL